MICCAQLFKIIVAGCLSSSVALEKAASGGSLQTAPRRGVPSALASQARRFFFIVAVALRSADTYHAVAASPLRTSDVSV